MTTRRTRKPCPGKSIRDGACIKCYRVVRIKNDGTPYQHRAKAPSDRSDPTHARRILEVYGITGDEYEGILKAQGGCCYICQQPPRSKRLAVDHDHEIERVMLAGGTNQQLAARASIRGLLCRRCNHRLLGSARDATEILKRAIDYLDNPPAHYVLRVQKAG